MLCYVNNFKIHFLNRIAVRMSLLVATIPHNNKTLYRCMALFHVNNRYDIAVVIKYNEFVWAKLNHGAFSGFVTFAIEMLHILGYL